MATEQSGDSVDRNCRPRKSSVTNVWRRWQSTVYKTLSALMITPHYSRVSNLQHQYNTGTVVSSGDQSCNEKCKKLWPGALWTTAPPGPDPGICILIAACILIITWLPPRSSAPPRTLALRGTGHQQSQVNELSYCSPIVICTVSHYFAQIQTFTIQSIVFHFGFPLKLRWSRYVLELYMRKPYVVVDISTKLSI